VFAGVDAAIGAFDKAFTELRELDFQVEKSGKRLEEVSRRDQTLRDAQTAKEVECGRYLAEVRKGWPNGRLPKSWQHGTWEQFCGLRKIHLRTAWNYIAKAEHVDKSESSSPDSDFPTQREVAAARREESPRSTVETTRWNPDNVPAKPANDAVPATPTRTGGRGKPQWLMQSIVRDYTRENDLVCDPLAGFGSTLIAAKATGRRAIGSEIDEKIALNTGIEDIRIGDWRTALGDAGQVNAVITDPPYSARTHAASRKFGNEREDGSSLEGLGPEYTAWTRDDVFEFVRHWSPRCEGWMVALTDHHLIHDWQEAYEDVGRYSFAPVGCLIRGMTVRLCGDGPSSWMLYVMVSRPPALSRWGTLPGAYVGTRDRADA
jgi:hypothetical protein